MMDANYPEAECSRNKLVTAYVMRLLPETDALALEMHASGCHSCQQRLRSLRAVVQRFVYWPTDVLRPTTPLRPKLAERIGSAKNEIEPPAPSGWREPPWEEVAPGIFCKLLARDAETHQVSMLVRLDPGVEYPPHRHASVEELHLLHGELWIDDRKLKPGDYNRAEPGTSDKRVWSETGCTCVLVTSARDELG